MRTIYILTWVFVRLTLRCYKQEHGTTRTTCIRPVFYVFYLEHEGQCHCASAKICSNFGKIKLKMNKANLRDLTTATGLVILPKSDPNRRFVAHVTLKFDEWHWKTIGHLFYATSSFVHHCVAISEFKVEFHSRNAQFESKWMGFFVLCDLETWKMTSKNNRAPLYATSSFVHHFVAIGEFKLDLQFGNPQFGSKSTILLAAWPWNLTDDLEKQ